MACLFPPERHRLRWTRIDGGFPHSYSAGQESRPFGARRMSTWRRSRPPTASAARAGLPGRGQAAVRALRRAVRCRRDADRADAHRRAVGDQQARRQPGHPGLRQGHLRQHVPGQRRTGRRRHRGLADRGRLRAHVHVRRAELGYLAALKTLEITCRPEVRNRPRPRCYGS